MKRISIVVSSPLTVRAFLQAQIEALSQQYEVWLVANTQGPDDLEFLPDAVRIFPVRIERQISPIRDLRALLRLTTFFHRNRFDLVHSVTPKAGLLTMTAAFAARVPIRIHTFTGQIWATRSGWSRAMLKLVDRLYAGLATYNFVDSHSQRDFLLREHVVRAEKSKVLGNGSISGVDVERFAPNQFDRSAIRSQLGILDHHVLFLFLGRLTRDKGVPELLEAFRLVSNKWSQAHLALVGSDEEGLAHTAVQDLERVHVFEFTQKPESFLNAADVLCLPSHREGFGTVVIEAACVGIPAVASRIYGLTDAIADRETGLLHRVGDVNELATCIAAMLEQPHWREELGTKARQRATTKFPTDLLTEALMQEYRQMLARLGVSQPP